MAAFRSSKHISILGHPILKRQIYASLAFLLIVVGAGASILYYVMLRNREAYLSVPEVAASVPEVAVSVPEVAVSVPEVAVSEVTPTKKALPNYEGSPSCACWSSISRQRG